MSSSVLSSALVAAPIPPPSLPIPPACRVKAVTIKLKSKVYFDDEVSAKLFDIYYNTHRDGRDPTAPRVSLNMRF
jgi:hypothetical protein